jgi:hypothetical protein
MATMAHTPSAPDHREIKPGIIIWVIIVATLEPGYDATISDIPSNAQRRPLIGRLLFIRHSLRSEAIDRIPPHAASLRST